MSSNNSFQLQSHKNHHQMNITLRYAIFSPHFSFSFSIIDICCFFFLLCRRSFVVCNTPTPHQISNVGGENFICGASNSQRYDENDEEGGKGWISVYIKSFYEFLFTHSLLRAMDFLVISCTVDHIKWLALNSLLQTHFTI